MNSLSKTAREDSLRKVGLLCFLRLEGYAEDEIAERLGFGSAEAMHTQLKNWGVAGLLPASGEIPNLNSDLRKRQARRSSGEAKELPRPARAADEFYDAIGHLGERVPNESTREFLQDGRFIELMRSGAIRLRECHNSQEWDWLCTWAGRDPATTDCFGESGHYIPLGGTPYPRKSLRNLIAACLLAADESDFVGCEDSDVEQMVECLLEKLHPEPEAADREKLTEIILSKKDGFLRRADQAALLIRGGTLKPGPNPAEVDQWEISVALTVQDLRARGVPEEEIPQRLIEELPEEDKHFFAHAPQEDLARLSNLRVRIPEEGRASEI